MIAQTAGDIAMIFPNILTKNEAIKLLGVSYSTWDRLENEGLVPRRIMRTKRHPGYLENEMNALKIARITGKSEGEIINTLEELATNRDELFSKLVSKDLA